jgi:CheY-like chemotaxis protein
MTRPASRPRGYSRAARRIASAERSTSASVVDQFDTEIRMAARPRQVVPISLQVAWDAEQALACLHHPVDGQRAADRILLDLKLPTQSGAQLLEALKADPQLGRIPVVLTSSAVAADVRHAYQHHANAYVTKPVDPDQFRQRLGAICRFWLDQARLR